MGCMMWAVDLVDGQGGYTEGFQVEHPVRSLEHQSEGEREGAVRAGPPLERDVILFPGARGCGGTWLAGSRVFVCVSVRAGRAVRCAC